MEIVGHSEDWLENAVPGHGVIRTLNKTSFRYQSQTKCHAVQLAIVIAANPALMALSAV
jgi:hypothetical protein